MDFNFIADNRFRQLLVADYAELSVCLNNNATKSVLILSGSIIEASLIEYFLQNLPKDQDEQKLLKLNIGQLIELAEKEGLLTLTQKNLASVVQDYRNLIHPGRQIRKNEAYTIDNARIASSLVNIILSAIKNKHSERNNLTADIIIKKLKNDSSYRTIYDDQIIQLSLSERKKLLEQLISFEIQQTDDWEVFLPEGVFQNNIQQQFHNLYNIKPLVMKLIPLLHEEVVPEKLQELVHHIQRGSNHNAFALFNLFHERVEELPLSDQEIIAIYMLSFYVDIIKYTKPLVRNATYSSIGKYIHTQKGQNTLEEFTKFCINNFTLESIHIQGVFYMQVFNSLSELNKIAIKKCIIDYVNNVGGMSRISTMAFVTNAIQNNIIDKEEIDYTSIFPQGRG